MPQFEFGFRPEADVRPLAENDRETRAGYGTISVRHRQKARRAGPAKSSKPIALAAMVATARTGLILIWLTGYPLLVIAAEELGTDPALAAAGTAGADDRFMRWVNESFYGELSRLAPAPGYIAPPLDGVWATAPYLHNDSVPTLEALLDSSKRPIYWTRSFRSSDYDEQTLGWNYTALAYGKGGAKDSDERKRIYDTTLPGYSNDGHVYGHALSDGERRQLLEYIKTL